MSDKTQVRFEIGPDCREIKRRKLTASLDPIASKQVTDAFADDEEDTTPWDEQAPGTFVFGQFLSLEDASSRSSRLEQEGVTLAEAQRFRPAIGRWNEAIECTPERFRLYEMKAQALMTLGEDFDAIKSVQTCVDMRPEWHQGWITLGRAQLGLGELDVALTSLQHALSLPSTDTSTMDEQLLEEVTSDIGFIKNLVKKRIAQQAAVDLSTTIYRRAIGMATTT
eukprot:m.124476 g.124476  ORF g.124476 m.124476 type:complete len:224 (-) comp29063_c0_seq3:132-803(-)